MLIVLLNLINLKEKLNEITILTIILPMKIEHKIIILYKTKLHTPI